MNDSFSLNSPTQDADLQSPGELNGRTSLYALPADIIKLFLRASQDLNYTSGCDHWVIDDDNSIEISSDTDSDDERGPQLVRLPSLDWRNLMNSCLLMRMTALETRGLWTIVNLEDVKSAVIYLERSGDMPLSLYFPLHASEESFRLLVSNASRAQEIEAHMQNIPSYHALPLCEFLSEHCPRLERIWVESFMRPFMAGRFDHLTFLHIDGGYFCPISVIHDHSDHNPNIPSLRILTLKNVQMEEGINTLIDLLRGFQGLEDLTLIGHQKLMGFDRITDPDDVKARRIIIPKLRSVTIESDVRTCGTFMRLFSDALPSHHLSIKVTESDVAESDDSSLADQVYSVYQREIVAQSRAFWKAASAGGSNSFPHGKLVIATTSRDFKEGLATWWVQHTARSISIYIRIIVDPSDARISLHDCKTLELRYLAETNWELLEGRLDGLKKVVINGIDEEFFRGPAQEFQSWLERRRESSLPVLKSIEFNQWKGKRQHREKVQRDLQGLAENIVWK